MLIKIINIMMKTVQQTKFSLKISFCHSFTIPSSYYYHNQACYYTSLTKGHDRPEYGISV
jgi:hypothetical protein